MARRTPSGRRARPQKGAMFVYHTRLAPNRLFCERDCALQSQEGPTRRDYKRYRFPDVTTLGMIERVAVEALTCYGCGLNLSGLASDRREESGGGTDE